MRRISIPLLILALTFTMCQGPEGPVGPDGQDGSQGAQGFQGPAGPGSRKVYSGIILNEWQAIDIPEVDLSNMPSIAVYVEAPDQVAAKIGGSIKATQSAWVELPYSHTDGYDIWFKYLFYLDDGVLIAFCEGLEYRIVVIE